MSASDWAAHRFESVLGCGDMVSLTHHGHSSAVAYPWEVRQIVAALLGSLDPGRREDLLREAMAGGPPDADGRRPWAPVAAKEGDGR